MVTVTDANRVARAPESDGVFPLSSRFTFA